LNFAFKTQNDLTETRITKKKVVLELFFENVIFEGKNTPYENFAPQQGFSLLDNFEDGGETKKRPKCCARDDC